MKALALVTNTKIAEDTTGTIWIWCAPCQRWERIYNYTWHVRHVHAEAWRELREQAKQIALGM